MSASKQTMISGVAYMTFRKDSLFMNVN